ncbi:hypothetical protein [Rhodopila sp.]|uniref:hypothetical protein n=1 Tax=Rhodopila sp. TaxID=2480087 RepID=UPI003D126D04
MDMTDRDKTRAHKIIGELYDLLAHHPGDAEDQPKAEPLLTDPDLTLSRHPARGTETKAAAFRREFDVILLPVGSPSASMTCSLCSTALPRFITTTEQSAPDRRISTFGLAVSAACAFSLGIVGQVLKFRTKARMRVTSPIHRTPFGQ